MGSVTAGDATGAIDLGVTETTRQVGSGRGRTSKLTGDRNVTGGAGAATGAIDVRSRGIARQDTSTDETAGATTGATDITGGKGTSY